MKSPTKSQYKFATPQPVTPGPSRHPGSFIRSEVLEPFGLTVVRAAELLKLQRVGLNNTLNGKTAVTADLAYRLEALTGIDADLLIAMQAAYERDRDVDKRQAYKATIARLELPAMSEKAS